MASTTTDIIDGVSTSTAIKSACRYATTGNITLSGLAVQANGPWASVLTSDVDRILVRSQTTASENGIYIANSSAWVRAADFDGNRDVVLGTLVPVVSTAGDYAMYQVTTENPIVIGTSSITFDDASYAALATNLANSADTALGAALVGYDGDTVYDALNDVMMVSGVRQGMTAATNIDAEFATWCVDYANTGIVLKLRPGVYTITAHYEIAGFTLDLTNGVEIECNGSDDTIFGDGFIEVLAGGRIVGGTVYTSGTMGGTFNASYTARSCVLLCNGGEIDGTTVYSQVNTGIKHYSGKLKKPMSIGSRWQGVNCYWTTDITQDIDVQTFNTGLQYIAKVPNPTANTSNVFACLVWFTVDITQQVLIKFSGTYSSANGLWINSATPGTITMDDLTVDSPKMDQSGRYLASGTTLTSGNASGTALEIIGAPNCVLIDPKSLDPLGYNVAISYCTNGVMHGGSSRSQGDDPNVVIVNSDEFTIYDHLAEGGTVGFSIGEDGATSNNVKVVGCAGKDNGYGPIRYTFAADGTKLFIDRFTAINGSVSSGFAGSLTGPGEMYDFCRVYNVGAVTQAHVSITNSTLSGEYTELFRCANSDTVLSVYENNNSYACPFVPPPIGEIWRGRGLFNSRSVAVPMITGATGGRANVGTFTINNATVNNSYVLNVTDIEPYVGTLAAASFDADDYYMVFYVKLATDMTGQLRIGLDDSGASSTSRYSTVVYLDTVTVNTEALLTDGYQVGEWMAFAVTLRSAVYSGVTDFAALTRLQVIKFGYSANYTLEMTNPVIVMRKAIS